MRKYTHSEGHIIVSPEAHKAIQAELTKLGKTSARELTEEQRVQLEKTVDMTDVTC